MFDLRKDEPIELFIKIKLRTKFAICFHCKDKTFWIPKSHVINYDESELIIGFTGYINIPYWLAYSKDLI